MIKVLVLILFLCGFSVNSGTRTDSSLLKTPDKRIQALQKYLKLKSPVLDAEFDIFNVNLNARYSIPGASDWDYKIALKIDPENIDSWLEDTKPETVTPDDAWSRDLIRNNNSFVIHSEPDYYQGKGKSVIVFKPDGILFLRFQNQQKGTQVE